MGGSVFRAWSYSEIFVSILWGGLREMPDWLVLICTASADMHRIQKSLK